MAKRYCDFCERILTDADFYRGNKHQCKACKRDKTPNPNRVDRKWCDYCEQVVPAERWGKDAFGRPRTRRCLDCVSEHFRQLYSLNPGRWIDRSAAARQARRMKLWDYLKDKSCIRCGEDDPIVLQFDHRDGETKVEGVSNMISTSKPWNMILEEISKCDILCANCHMRRTADQFGWYAHLRDAPPRTRRPGKLSRGHIPITSDGDT